VKLIRLVQLVQLPQLVQPLELTLAISAPIRRAAVRA
jgi:hypothetical protein